jgi:hypothetical protein
MHNINRDRQSVIIRDALHITTIPSSNSSFSALPYFGYNITLLLWRALGLSLAEKWKHTLDVIFEKINLVMQFPWLLKVINILPDCLAGLLVRHHRKTRNHFLPFLDMTQPQRRIQTRSSTNSEIVNHRSWRK